MLSKRLKNYVKRKISDSLLLAEAGQLRELLHVAKTTNHPESRDIAVVLLEQLNNAHSMVSGIV